MLRMLSRSRSKGGFRKTWGKKCDWSSDFPCLFITAFKMKLQTWSYISKKGMSPSPRGFWNEVKYNIFLITAVYPLQEIKNLQWWLFWNRREQKGLKMIDKIFENAQASVLCWLSVRLCFPVHKLFLKIQPDIPSHLRFGSKQLSVWSIKAFKHTNSPTGSKP